MLQYNPVDAVTINNVGTVPTEGADVSDDATPTPTHSGLQSVSSGMCSMLCVDVH